MSRTVAILGYGAVGRETARLFAARGDEVRIFQRSRPDGLPEGARFHPGSLADAEAVASAVAGADTVICAAGLRYVADVWEREWPLAMTTMLAASEKSRARFVFADNLYMYGPQTTPLREDMPLTDFGRKPKVRAAITRQWQAAHTQGRVRATAVRAADFYGPRVGTSVISHYGIAPLVKGKTIYLPYSPDFPHDFTYVPDFARALLTLADAPDTDYGQAWHVPNAPTLSLRQVLERAGELAGKAPRISVMPGLLKTVFGWFTPELKELAEMSFQTDRPYRVDTARFRGRFWSDATSFDDGLRATIASYRS